MKPFLFSLLILLVLAPVAYAARFHGITTQDRKALVVTEEGMPGHIKIRWRADCGNGRLQAATSFRAPFDESTSTFARARVEGTHRIEDADGRNYKFHAVARIRARQVTDNKWRGRFRVSGELRHNGELFTRCDSGVIRWRATR